MSKTPEEIIALAKKYGNALYQTSGALSRFDWNRQKVAQAYRIGNLEERENSAADLAESREDYHSRVSEARGALASLGESPRCTLLLNGSSFEVDVLAEATLVDKWGQQVIDQAIGVMEQAKGRWDRIRNDPSSYTSPAEPVLATNPDELQKLRAEVAELRADVERLKRKRPWTRNQKIAVWVGTLAPVATVVGGAGVLRSCASDHDRSDPSLESRPSQKPISPDGSTKPAESASAVGQSTIPQASASDAPAASGPTARPSSRSSP